jgi:uncharacterized protein YegP (UPF0339 family)
MSPMRFTIRPAEGGYRVRYESARNNKVILWSQVYDDLRDAEHAIDLTKLYAATAPVDRSQVRRAS